jgi:hypothetical protein
MLTLVVSPITEMVPMSLSAIIQTLSEHSEVDRIGKLLQWVYTGRWENTVTPFSQCPIGQILPELLKRTPCYDVLERRLYQAAASLNKPERYKKIAAIILETCTVLYSPTISTPSVEIQTKEMLTGMMGEDPTEDFAQTTALTQRDCFELRHQIMQQVPPLKVKILLFSVLRHPFSFNSSDWKELKTQSLDVWLDELIQAFPLIEVLENKLLAQATQLERLDQGTQIANAIIRAVRIEIP